MADLFACGCTGGVRATIYTRTLTSAEKFNVTAGTAAGCVCLLTSPKSGAGASPHRQRPVCYRCQDLSAFTRSSSEDSLCEEKLDIRLRKSRLALQLASSLHRLYPGTLDPAELECPKPVQLINRQNGDAGPGEMDRLCVPLQFRPQLENHQPSLAGI